MSLWQFLLLLILGAIWGASFMFMRVAAPEFGPFALIALRVSLASLVLLPIWYLKTARQERRTVKEQWHHLLIVGLFNSAIPFVLFAYATLHISGGMASILNSTATLWTAIVAWVWLKNSPSKQSALGLLVGVIGVAVLVAGSLGDNHATSVVSDAGAGIAAAAFAAILYAIAANYAAVKMRGVASLTIATFSLVAASIVLIPLALMTMPSNSISSTAWLAVIALAIVSTAIANIIYFHLLAVIGPTKTVTVTFLIPIFGVIWGVLFIDEQMTQGMVVGGAVILLGLALVTNVFSLKKFSKLELFNEQKE